MNFYYNGKKAPSKGYDAASGCLIIIGFSALIYFFKSLDDLEDLKEYWLQLLFLVMIAFSLFYGLFRKKGKLHTYRIDVDDSCISMHEFKAKIEDLRLDLYFKNDSFERYHLWDTKGNIALYSIYEDDLSKYLIENFSNQVQKFEIFKSSSPSFEVEVNCKERLLSYNLDSGSYTIENSKTIIAKNTPKAYAYDGKYKAGKNLLKKK
jgi:hypothetical protein